MIRLVLIVAAIIIYLILTLPVVLVLYLIGLKKPETKRRAAAAMIRWFLRVLKVLAGTKLTVIGADRVPQDSAVLYVGNHRSLFDVVLALPLTKNFTGFVAKNTLRKVPMFGVWMTFIGCILFDRDDIKDGMRMIKAGTEELKNGNSIFIFPEGTRNKAPEELPLLEFHEGSFRMAMKSKCPVVPVAITGTADILEKHFPLIRSCPVTIEFCEPIYPDDIPKEMRKKIGVMTSSFIEERISANKS